MCLPFLQDKETTGQSELRKRHVSIPVNNCQPPLATTVCDVDVTVRVAPNTGATYARPELDCSASDLSGAAIHAYHSVASGS